MPRSISRYAALYAISLVAFLVLDLTWLGVVAVVDLARGAVLSASVASLGTAFGLRRAAAA